MQPRSALPEKEAHPPGRSRGVFEASPRSGPFLLADAEADRDNTGLVWLARLMIAVSLIAFGIQQFVYSGHVPDLGLVPEWAPEHLLWAWLAGAILVFAGVAVVSGACARLAAVFLGFVFLLSAFLRFSTHIPGMIHNIGDRGVFFELLACCGGSWMLARTFSGLRYDWKPPVVSERLAARLATAGRWLFGCAFVVFGSLHLQAPKWIAALIPHWIPFPVFLAWLTGCALVAAGLSIAAKVWMRYSAALLALMLLSWVVLVHAPRIAHALHDGDEWNSGFVCLVMAGFACIAAASMGTHRLAANEKSVPADEEGGSLF